MSVSAFRSARACPCSPLRRAVAVCPQSCREALPPSLHLPGAVLRRRGRRRSRNVIQGEGFNPLWRQILIIFNDGFTPHQFISEEEIEAAAGTNPEITLVETDEVYRCSV